MKLSSTHHTLRSCDLRCAGKAPSPRGVVAKLPDRRCRMSGHARASRRGAPLRHVAHVVRNPDICHCVWLRLSVKYTKFHTASVEIEPRRPRRSRFYERCRHDGLLPLVEVRRSCTPRRARVVQHFLTRRILSVEARYLHYFVIALLYQVHAHMMCATHAEVSDRCRRQNENGSSRLILSYLHPMLLHLKRFTLTSEA